jgi:hypothetical protein
MNSIRICIILLFIAFCCNAVAGEVMDFELKDGSVIHGRLESFVNGRYTIKTKSLGTMTINESKVKVIRMGDRTQTSEEAAKPAAAPAGADVQGMVTKMQGNDDIMALINTLKDDPEMQAVINDPQVLKAISAGDYSALMANPKFMELLNNPKVLEIQKKMGQ